MSPLLTQVICYFFRVCFTSILLTFQLIPPPKFTCCPHSLLTSPMSWLRLLYIVCKLFLKVLSRL